MVASEVRHARSKPGSLVDANTGVGTALPLDDRLELALLRAVGDDDLEDRGAAETEAAELRWLEVAEMAEALGA